MKVLKNKRKLQPNQIPESKNYKEVWLQCN